jgi:hypothetical protein
VNILLGFDLFKAFNSDVNECPFCFKEEENEIEIFRYEDKIMFVLNCKYCKKIWFNEEFFNFRNDIFFRYYNICPKCKRIQIHRTKEIKTEIDGNDLVFIHKCYFCKANIFSVIKDIKESIEELGIPFKNEYFNFKKHNIKENV